MRFQITYPCAPSDPVVAVHRSRSDADAAMRTLTRVGFGDDMLELIGQRGDGPTFPRELVKPLARPWRGAAPGLLLGALWASFIVATTLALPANEARLPLLLALGILVLSLQAMLVRRVTRPRTSRMHPAAPVRPQPPRDTIKGPAWRFLVVVHGTRSEVALARDMLAI